MKKKLAELLTSKTVIAVQLLLITLLLLLVWIFSEFNVAQAILTVRETLPVQVSRFEFFLVLVLLMLNVSLAYGVYRQFSKINKLIRCSTGLMIVSLLILSVWLGRLFLLTGMRDTMASELTSDVGRSEVILVLVLILANILGGIALFRRYREVEPFVVISAYSKRVQHDGRWISIEEYLAKELGIRVSHGITPEEKERALEQFREEERRESLRAQHPTQHNAASL